MRYALVILVVVATGCGGRARVVLRDGYGGVLALEGKQDKARRNAEDLIAAHCGHRGSAILREEEVPVGSQVTYQAQRRGQAEGVLTDDGVVVESRRNTTAVVRESTVTELRITYACGMAPQATAQAAAPAPALVAPSPAGSAAVTAPPNGAPTLPPIVEPVPIAAPPAASATP